MKAEIESVEMKSYDGDYFNAVRVVVNMTEKDALMLIERLAECLRDSIFEGPRCSLVEASIATHLLDESKNTSLNGRGEIRFVVKK